MELVTQGQREEEAGIENLSVDLDELGEKYQMNKTRNDVFVSKLCMDDEDEVGQEHNQVAGDIAFDEECENNPECEEHCIFNKEIPWKKQKPILGMRFENPKQLKHMLCNY